MREAVKYLGVGLALTAAAAAGCTKKEASPQASTDPSPTAVVKTVEIPDPPTNLPLAIAKAAKNIVAISSLGYDYEGSGIRLDNSNVLTAGHVLTLENGTIPSNWYNDCSHLDAYEDVPNPANASAPAGAFGEKAAIVFTDKEDLAIFKLGDSGNTTPTSGVPVDSSPLTPGELVYFVNFEPTAAHKPTAPESTQPSQFNPSIYAGVVLGADQNPSSSNDVDILTGLRAYGTGIAASNIGGRPGSSGGAILAMVNGQAEVQAVVSRGSENLTTPQGIWQETTYQPTGPVVKANTALNYTLAQPVNAKLIGGPISQSNSQPACTFPVIP